MSSNEPASSRAINLGRSVDLTKLGTVVVREPTLEGIIRVSGSLVSVMNVFIADKEGLTEADGLAIMLKLVKSPATIDAIRAIFAELTDKKPADFEELPLSDLAKLIEAVRNVVDWAELKDLFIRLIPMEMRTSLSQNLMSKIATVS